MRKQLTLALAVSLAGLAALSGCGYRYYTVLSQPTSPAPAVQQAMTYKVRPLDLSRIRFTDLGYKDEATFRAEFAAVPAGYQGAFPRFAAELGLVSRQLQFVGAQDPVADGILIEVVVDKIQLNWNVWSGHPDQFFITITFTDKATNAVLYQGKVDINNRSYGFGGGWASMAFTNRMQYGAANIAWVVSLIMKHGMVNPYKW
jgi:hypothetical protein